MPPPGSDLDAPTLPEEIWSKVFSYLPLDDRKNLQLCCQRFYEIATSLRLQKTEKLVFHGNLTTSAAMEFLSTGCSSRKLWNVELNAVNIQDDSFLSFFRHQGAKVRSLKLHDCNAAPRLMSGIVEYCKNLREFSLSFSAEWYGALIDDFKVLRNKGIINENVKNFTFHVYNQSALRNFALSNEKFLNFFAVFPNIKVLDLTFFVDHNFDSSSSDMSEITSSTRFSFPCVYYQVHRMRHQLERLTLFCLSTCGMDLLISLGIWNKIPSIEMKNLKELSLSFTCFSCAATTRVNNLTEFTYLTDVSIHNAPPSIPRSSIIHNILNTTKQIRSMSIRLDIVVIDRNCFQALVKSPLKNLSVTSFRGVTFIDFDYHSLENCLSPNHNLKYLYLNVGGSNTVLLFTTYFHSLERLEVAKFDESIFKDIFKYQTKLSILILRNWCSPPTQSRKNSPFLSPQHWSRTQDNFNRQINYLRHLFIFEDKSLELSEFLLSEFVFPNLESLNISASSAVLYDNTNLYLFWLSIKKLINLKFLRIQWDIDVPYSQWLAICATLPKLRYLLICSVQALLVFSHDEYHQLFDICPSLRILFHGHHDIYRGTMRYFKDILTNIVNERLVPTDPVNFREFSFEGIPLKYYDILVPSRTLVDRHIFYL